MPTDKQAITEESGVHKQWYERARKMTLAKLPEFLRELTEDYSHDYGTICHAISAAAVAAAWAVERSPTGGITGFQAGCVMWGFCRHWQSWGDEPRRLIDYSNLLFPQHEETFTAISREVWDWAQAEAKKNLAESSALAARPVVDHWRSIAAGRVPFGLRIED